MPLTIPTNPGVPVLGSATFDTDAGANLAWQKSFADEMENKSVLVAGDGGLLGRAPALTSNSVDSTGLGGAYYGYGGAHAGASGGDNPFPGLNGAFLLEVQQGNFGNNGDYTVQVATVFSNTTIERKYRSRAITTSGYSPWIYITPERGSGPNGDWVRFADGLQVCTHLQTIGNASTASGSIWVNTAEVGWTFPASFVATAGLATAASPRTATTAWGRCRAVSVNAVNYRICASTNMGAGSVDMELMAIGRWK